MPLYEESAPRNSSVNVLLNLITKGVSTRMKDSFSHELANAVDKWRKNTEIEIENISLSRSFLKHHLRYKDTYLKYIQFRTLHHRFYTNENLQNGYQRV